MSEISSKDTARVRLISVGAIAGIGCDGTTSHVSQFLAASEQMARWPQAWQAPG